MTHINNNIVLIKAEDITPYEGSHKSNEAAINMIVESISRYGLTQPISVDKNNVIVAGNSVYKAAVKAGIKEIPCIVLDHLTDDEINQYRIADNKTGGFAKWNEEKLKRELTYLRQPDDLQFAFDENIKNMLGQGFGTEFAPRGTVSSMPIPQRQPTEEEAKAEAKKYLESVEKFRQDIGNVDRQNAPKPVDYIEFVCSKCGKTVRVR